MPRTPLKKAKPPKLGCFNLRVWGESISKDSPVRNGIALCAISGDSFAPYGISPDVGCTTLTGTPSTSTP